MNMGARQMKKNAFLAGHSAKALTSLPVSGTIAIYAIFYVQTYMYKFLKPVNSDMEIGLKKHRKCPLKIIIYSGYWKLGMTLFERQHNNTAKMMISL